MDKFVHVEQFRCIADFIVDAQKIFNKILQTNLYVSQSVCMALCLSLLLF